MASWSKPTFARRLFLGLVAYSAVLVGCFAIFQYHRERDFKAEEIDLRLQAINERILDDLADSIPLRFDPAYLKHTFTDLRVSIIDSTGHVLYDNTLDTLPGSNHLKRTEIADALATGRGFTVRRHSESTGLTYCYAAAYDGHLVVRTAVPYSMTLTRLLAPDFGFLWFLLTLTAVMCIIGYWVTRRLGNHIRRLSSFARMAERGERIIDTEAFPHDELGEISSHIVRLYARLQQAIADRDREHRTALHQEQEKIRIKRRLTNNINHELKTPVASMQVCLDTLASHPGMAPEKRAEFIERCIKANERLRQLLSDVAAVTRLEDGGESINREEIDLAAVVAEVCDEYLPEATGKGVEIINRLSSPMTLQGNASLLTSVFRNLIANALVHSGCSTVTIDGEAQPGQYIVTVADDGTGVAPEHLPRLFERFYRIDKGRSRRAGGTGLGLAIVKNAILWHRGTIRVDNRNTGGLRFTVTFPR